ncbi:MAG: trypsin-like peptidase domain-containing protein [Clostridiales bacterium]|jgi:serine protease Do|nr:trypsin-like peptidase domain-containing protein [Clostridiales bacterium]
MDDKKINFDSIFIPEEGIAGAKPDGMSAEPSAARASIPEAAKAPDPVAPAGAPEAFPGPAYPFGPPQPYMDQNPAVPPASYYRGPVEPYQPPQYYRPAGAYAEPPMGYEPRQADPYYYPRPADGGYGQRQPDPIYPRQYYNQGQQAQPIAPAPVPAPAPMPKKKRELPLFWKKTFAAAILAVLAFGTLGLGLGVGGRLATKAFPNATAEENTENFTFPVDASSYIISNAEKTTANISDIVKKVSDAVVSINVTVMAENYFHQTTEMPGAGSGIIFSEDSEKVYIATNEHVISEANKVTISTDDKNEVEAHFVGSDEESDLAVISVSKAELIEKGIEYQLSDFGDSDILRVGDSVVAVGNAMGEGKTATSGIISAINKQITVDGKTLDVMQTDAAINPGNSGGALANSAGEVIGINTAKLTANRVEGMGYSIPSNTVKKIIEGLISNGSADRAYLGITGQNVSESTKEMYNLPSLGVYIVEVTEGGAAALAGIRPTDIVVSFNGKTIETIEELSGEIGKAQVGDEVTIGILRNGTQTMEIKAVLGNLVNDTKF